MKRVIFVLGIGIGFVLGARAGRARYDSIKRTAQRIANNESVQRGVATAQQVFDEATPVVVDRTRHYAGQAGEVSKRAAARLGDGAAHVGESVTEAASEVYERLTTSADDLSARVTHTADDLRTRSEDLRRRGEDSFDSLGKRVEEQVERSRASQAEGFVRVGDLREQALAEIESEDDDMLEPNGDANRDRADEN